MKILSLDTCLGVWILIASCKNSPDKGQKDNVSPRQNSAYSPIEGNWELVSNVVNGKLVRPKRTQQFKAFHDGYFYFFMYDSLGNFYGSGAGPYEIEGNTYKETFNYYSDTVYIGSSDWQEWKMQGDTLVFYGFTKAIMADGRDVTDEWGRSKFVEKRGRIRR